MNNIETIIKEAVDKILNMEPNTHECFGTFIVYFYLKEGLGGIWDIMNSDELILDSLSADDYNNDDEFTEDLLKIIF